MAFPDGTEVIYDAVQWTLLHDLWGKAVKVMDALAARRLSSAVYGSVARGDVNKKSDVDVIIPDVASSHAVELALQLGGFQLYSRRIAQATPGHTPKAHIFLDAVEETCVTFPLASLRALEREFYRFGGFQQVDGVKAGQRVPGCDKRLMLIQPTPMGHVETPIVGREREVARIVGVSVAIVGERIRVLTRREQVGRTGIVLSRELEEDEVFEEALKQVADVNPIVRRRLARK